MLCFVCWRRGRKESYLIDYEHEQRSKAKPIEFGQNAQQSDLIIALIERHGKRQTWSHAIFV